MNAHVWILLLEVRLGWEMLDFTFKGADKQQEKGLELTLVSGWVPQVQAETPTLSPHSEHQKNPGLGDSAPKMKFSSGWRW